MRVYHPLVLAPQPPAGGASQRVAGGAVPQAFNPNPLGYTPEQMRAYLGLSGDGSGQTIAITTAFHAPNIFDDVNAFSDRFGLPPACDERHGQKPQRADCFSLVVAMPQGLPPVDDGWALEASLDVEWTHALAPRARILLVEGIVDEIDPMMQAIDYAARHGADVISNSWYTEEFEGEQAYDGHCRLHRAVCVFASGDDGHEATYPASSPYVVGVGGTTLKLANDGSVLSEVAWSFSGGGVSAFEGRPAYQASVQSTDSRGAPDVSYDANPSTGVAIYSTLGLGGFSGWLLAGGTSAGAPQWAAIIAIADQLRREAHDRPLSAFNGSAHRAIYAATTTSALFDVVSGNNGLCGTLCTAGTGYDFVTGIGSPRAGIDAALARSRVD